MALAESMKNFVNELKASRRSRHEFVKGNRQIAKSIMAENRKFLKSIQAQNKINAEQTHMFLKSAKETRAANFKETKKSVQAALDRIHQSKDAISQGAKAMIKEFRQDTEKAHEYWSSLASDEPITDSGDRVKSAPFKESSSTSSPVNNKDLNTENLSTKDLDTGLEKEKVEEKNQQTTSDDKP
jgi:hypothetical protein